MSDKHLPEKSASTQKSTLQIRLLKGPIYENKQRELWQWLLRDQYVIREYFTQIGLSLLIDEAEGYAFLKQSDSEDENSELPRLITRRALPFAQSLLLLLLRKRLAEHDGEESDPRLIIQRADIHQWLSPHFQAKNNELTQQREFNALIKKVCDLGFLSPLTNYPDEFEVQRIIKAFINAEQIAEQLSLLQAYAKKGSQDELSRN